MRRRTPHTLEQLRLFTIPPTHTAGTTRLRSWMRVPLTLLAIGIATTGVVGGSFAVWNTQTNNPGNAVTAGQLSIANDKSAASVFSASGIVPGDTGSGTVTITNDGTVPLGVLLTQDTVSSSGIEASLGLKVHDQSRNWCYWPVSQSGACPAAYGAWNASSALDALAIPATGGGAKWPVGQAHTFTISWQLAATSPNSDQGKTGSFRLVWDGTS